MLTGPLKRSGSTGLIASKKIIFLKTLYTEEAKDLALDIHILCEGDLREDGRDCIGPHDWKNHL